jgi:hypothetical protein
MASQTAPVPSQPFPRPGWLTNDILLADATVKVGETNAALQLIVIRAAEAHYGIFRLPLVITSGNDGTHAPGSKHYKDKAIDIRSHDLAPDEQAAFAAALFYLAGRLSFGVFDERGLGSAHWHLEVN